MAKPAFIYAFDNLGPERFTELCGLLLGSRYKGFLLGGVGPDGGVDGEIDYHLGEWYPETPSPLLDELIPPEQLVLFQFKHKTMIRLGQAQARSDLLSLYSCSSKKVCELHRTLILKKHPGVYVLVTNVEVNAPFREKFIQQCRVENPDIKHYQIIGLDELEAWITALPELRHLYFPTIFGPPRFDLRLQFGTTIPYYPPGHRGHPLKDMFSVSILNTGIVPSYVSVIRFRISVNGQIQIGTPFRMGNSSTDYSMQNINPQPGIPIEPGRKQIYHFLFSDFNSLKENERDVFPVEAIVEDEIGNVYSEVIPEGYRESFRSAPSPTI